MRRFGLKERGVSSVVGFLLVLAVSLTFGSYILVTTGRQAEVRASGLVDAMRRAEERQNQLLTFVYARENSDAEELRAHFYNYGTAKISVDELWVNGNTPSTGDVSFSAEDGTPPGNSFGTGELTLVRVENVYSYAPAPLDSYALTFLTESNSLYSYLIARGD